MKILKNWKISLPLLVIILCFFAFLLAPNDPEKINLLMRLQSPSWQYPFGTDSQGRCLASRIFYGARLSIGIVLGSSILIVITACPVGLMMGYSGDKTRWLTESILNSVTALPPIAYLMVFIGAWGNGVVTTFLALTLSIFPRLVKLVKTKTEIERNRAYVLCAIVSGASKTRQMFCHILPNCLKEIISFMSLMCAEMIMMITSFSFIGIGLGDNAIDLGGVIQEAYQVVLIRPEILVFPILFVVLISLAFNLLGQNVE
jgi:ABC-type dipeptide/oligopeptide/nickel transport system permease subunit